MFACCVVNIIKTLHKNNLDRTPTPLPNAQSLRLQHTRKPNDYDFFVFHASSLRRFIWREHVGNHR